MALGLTTCSAEIHQAFVEEDKLKTFFHGHSYTGNALACAAAKASLELLTSVEHQNNIKRIESKHAEFKRKIELQFNHKVSKVNHLGTVISLELKTGESSSYFNNLRDYLYNYFLERNILLRPLGNVLYIIPPYVITNEELELIYSELEGLLEEL